MALEVKYQRSYESLDGVGDEMKRRLDSSVGQAVSSRILVGYGSPCLLECGMSGRECSGAGVDDIDGEIGRRGYG